MGLDSFKTEDSTGSNVNNSGGRTTSGTIKSIEQAMQTKECQLVKLNKLSKKQTEI